MANALPEGFAELEPFADWAIYSEKARYAKRLASNMDEITAFYEAAHAKIDDALAYLEKYEVDDLSEEGQRLLWLYCSLITCSFAVECWRQPFVPDAGAASIDAVYEPAI